MKLIPLYEEWLRINEIGDLSSSPFPWKFEKELADNWTYSFVSKSGLQYYYYFDPLGEKNTYDMIFKVKGQETKTLTGKDELYGIMSTAFEIIQDFLERQPNTKSLMLTGDAKKGERNTQETAKSRIYYEFLMKNKNKLSNVKEIKQLKNFIIIRFK